MNLKIGCLRKLVFLLLINFSLVNSSFAASSPPEEHNRASCKVSGSGRFSIPKILMGIGIVGLMTGTNANPEERNVSTAFITPHPSPLGDMVPGEIGNSTYSYAVTSADGVVQVLDEKTPSEDSQDRAQIIAQCKKIQDSIDKLMFPFGGDTVAAMDSLLGPEQHPLASSFLAMYPDIPGFWQNKGRVPKSLSWLKEEVSKNNPYAQMTLAVIYANGRLVPRNEAKSIQLLQSSADQGLVQAQVILGLLHEKGGLVPKDESKAAELYRLAADQGYAVAQWNLGVLHLKGKGVLKDASKAAELYRLAAEQGYALAQFNLAELYENGLGVPKDKEEAMRWHERAAANGIEEAKKRLEQVEGIRCVIA